MGKVPFDPYAVLQVAQTADPAVIRAAYRALARLNHPDLSSDPDSSERMARINEAYSILSDPVARSAHDANSTLPAPPPAWAAPTPPAPPRRAGERPASSVIDFGRYAGYSIDELARLDQDYLRWLASSRSGMRYRTEIYAALAGVTPRQAPATGADKAPKRFGFWGG